MHSRSIMGSLHDNPQALQQQQQQQQRPAFSAVVSERLHIQEIGEFVSCTFPSFNAAWALLVLLALQVLYEDGRARAFFADGTICELCQGAGVQVTDAGGVSHSLTCRRVPVVFVAA